MQRCGELRRAIVNVPSRPRSPRGVRERRARSGRRRHWVGLVKEATGSGGSEKCLQILSQRLTVAGRGETTPVCATVEFDERGGHCGLMSCQVAANGQGLTSVVRRCDGAVEGLRKRTS